MKIKQNSTDIPNNIIRKACAFVAGELENFSLKDVRVLKVKNTKRRFTGYAYYDGHEVVIRIGPANHFPVESKRLGVKFRVESRVEGLVAIIAHEFGHVWQGKKHQTSRRPGTSQEVERQCERFEKLILKAFRERSEEFLEAWGIGPDCKPKAEPEAPVSDIVAERAANVESKVAEWEAEIVKRERALKRAKKTLTKWKAKRRYYQKKLSEPGRQLAAKGSKPRKLKPETVLKNKIAKFIRLYLRDRYGIQSGTHELSFSEFINREGEPCLTRPAPDVVEDPFVDFFEWKDMKKLVALGDVLEVHAYNRRTGERDGMGEDVPIPETEEKLEQEIERFAK